MAPTSDERREVAESLRARSIGLALSFHNARDSLNDMWVQRTLREIREAIRCDGDPHPAHWLVRLADLIDPTCEVVSYEKFFGSSGCEEAGTRFVLSCGHETIVDGDYPPSYCSECGARVTGGGER